MQVMGELRRLDRIEGAETNIAILLMYDDGAFALAKTSGAISPAAF
jgi:hypothetical protein